jgi:hypothetical protein
MEELTQQEKQMINRIVNGNFMVSLVKTLSEEMEYFRDTYGGNEKNVFKRIVKNCELLFDPKKCTKEELTEVETISDAMIDSIYHLRKQYRSHVEKQMIERKKKKNE